MAEPTPESSRSSLEQPWPVRVVSQRIGEWIGRLGWVWVDGQIAQISRRPGASTVFLTLRDPSADLSLTVTTNRDVLDRNAPNLAEGARVVIHAKPAFYPARGTLSLRADDVRQVGLGELLARIEQLRKLLRAEGLFDPDRKRRPPFLPRRVGVITGRGSAAERDVAAVSQRRWPAVQLRVVNVPVQGPTAVPQIIEALRMLDSDDGVDVIILARGGGSVEDLLPFSDEALCRAVFAARTPVVTAIGHESDSPLVDFVADLRAATPTDAAKRVVPDLAEETRLVVTGRQRIRRAVAGLVDREQHRLDAYRSRPVLARPQVLVSARAEETTAWRDRARRCLGHRLDAAADELRHTHARLRALSPAATMARGYAVVQRGDGRVVLDSDEVTAGDSLRIRLAVGDLHATVDATRPATAD
ncbi:exodeoxyribonuclease VII large subunit [Natronosporangium hydrolyticum]|uniref:Exodeoxyribonuclease 7 large subunit n=1 Tax=Natronosporangium hydrolyticum TaxID=2811111 RepID=A0A895YH85_9ACTN|nr:exodeoxyribonuclease VII large subunit [Natronosporangium hydrolyticum]QSB13886.1 exodeoxyribonuclease VII large subunit [Natronosporangium hydrolyticum]